MSQNPIARTNTAWALPSVIFSRSAKDRYLPESGLSWIDGKPSRSQNHRDPTTWDARHATAAGHQGRVRR
ncbi:hypothetical protein ACFCV9_25045 [Streptomyces sp. NPDC056367]|uniref:hypothetical protein n=1 Tax=Streptomyces sp. NPDC056367 TaxID=3345797 RepID=UPI0035D6ECAA